jgi:hypothetical protein
MNSDPNDVNRPVQSDEYPPGFVANTGANHTGANTYYNTTPAYAYGAMPRKNKDRIKPVRVLLWVISIITFCSGWGLVGRSTMIEHFLNGTSELMRCWGLGLMVGSGVVILGNGVWGVVRWVLHWRREKWRTGKVIGKLIGGGIWRGLVFSTIALMAFLLIPDAVAGLFQPEEYALSTTEKITEAYAAGEISVAEYVKEAAYATFDPMKVSEEYRGENRVTCLDFLDIATEHVSELENETIEYITIKILMLDSGITTGSIASNNTGTALAADGVTNKINRLTLSGNGKFAVYWADSGINGITEEQAENIGEMFERDAARAESLFGISFEFEPKHEDIFDTAKNWLLFVDDWKPLEKLSDKEGIAFDRVKQAMPVYIISPGDLTTSSGTGAFYTGKSVIDWLSAASVVVGMGTDIAEMGSHTMSIPMFPAITILPKFIDNPHMETITAHEFGHHYQEVYGGHSLIDNEYNEAHANYFAARVVENQESVLKSVAWIRSHHKAYLEYNSWPIDTDNDYVINFKGYRNFGYLVNYAMEVEGGDGYIWEALKKGKSAYEWLTKQAGDANKKLWAGILERNLTGDYGYIKVLVPSIRPHGMAEKHDYYHAENFLNEDGYSVHSTFASRLSTDYFYISGEEYINDRVRVISGEDDLVGVFMGYKSESDHWDRLDGFGGKEERTFELSAYSDDYDKFAICVANSGLEDSSYPAGFSIQFIPSELDEIVDREALAEAYLESVIGEGFRISGNCIEFTTDNIFNVIRKIFEIAQELGAEDVDEIISELEQQRRDTEFTRITICLIPIKENVPRKEIEKRAALAMGVRYTLSFTLGKGEDQMIIGVGHSFLTNVSKVYVVMGDGGSDRVLITMRFVRVAR